MSNHWIVSIQILLCLLICSIRIEALVIPKSYHLWGSRHLTTSKGLFPKSALLMAGGQVPMVPYYPNINNKQEYMWMDIYNTLGRQDRTVFVSR